MFSFFRKPVEFETGHADVRPPPVPQPERKPAAIVNVGAPLNEAEPPKNDLIAASKDVMARLDGQRARTQTLRKNLSRNWSKESDHAYSSLVRPDDKWKHARIEDILTHLGVKQEHIRHAMSRISKIKGENLTDVMLDFGFVGPETMARAISMQTGFPYFPDTLVDLVEKQALEGITIEKPTGYVPVGVNRGGGLLHSITHNLNTRP